MFILFKRFECYFHESCTVQSDDREKSDESERTIDRRFKNYYAEKGGI